MAKPKQPKQYVGIDSVKGTNTTGIILGIVGVVVALLFAALIWNSTKSSDDEADAPSSAAPYRAVTVQGSPLPGQYTDPQQKTLNEATGAQAPSLMGQSFTGDPVNIAQDGRPKALMFIAHWCPHCQREVPLLSDWIGENKTKYPVDYYAVATSTDPTRPNYPPYDWLEKEKWPTPVLADDKQSAAANAYGLASFPYFVFLDANNKVVTRTSGEISMTDFEELVQRTANAPK